MYILLHALMCHCT